MQNHKQEILIFNYDGICLTKSCDQIPPGKYFFSKNVRSYQRGIIESRRGQTVLNSSAIADSNIHSMRRLENDLPTASQAQALIVGAGGNLYSSNVAFSTLTNRDTGYSGDPLSMVMFRPNRSAEPWMYVSDRSRSRKIKVNGDDFAQGISNPTTEPTVSYDQFQFNIIQSFNTVPGAMTVAGTAGALALQARVNTTIAQILYDSGTSGWASISPTTPTDDIQAGSRIIINNGGGSGEQILIESVYKAIPSTTIAAISYDSGSTGLCTIVLTATPKEGLVKDALIRIAAAENVRILSVIPGPNGVPCFRCSTTATRSAGDAVAGLNSFRVFLSNNHAAGETLTSDGARTTVTTGTGTVSQVTNINGAVIANRPTGPDDFFHISLKVDLLENITEIRLMFDVDSTTNDFTKNYYYKAIRANDFVPAVQGTITQLTAKQRKLQRRLVDLERRLAKSDIPEKRRKRLTEKRDDLAQRLKDLETNSPVDVERSSDETVTGASQWTEFFVRLKDLERVGSDKSRGVADIKAWRLSFNVTGSTVIDMDDLLFGGGYGPDVGDVGIPYIYRYRYRSSATGAKSFPSPESRGGIIVHRQKITLTPTTSGDAQVDKIDWFRFGGSIPDWTYIGTQANSGSFTDEFGDDDIFNNEGLEFEDFKPFPVTDTPKTGVCNIVGTSLIYVSGDTFNTSWPEGTVIIINSVPTTLYTNPSSTTRAQLKENLGNLSNVSFFIPEPTIPGTSLPSLWGPFGQGEQGTVMFACGDLFNPGTLYWTNIDDPDSSSDKNFLEVTSPSEPLLNGFLKDGRSFVWSSDDLYIIYPAQTLEGRLTFKSNTTGLKMGLAGRYAFCVGEGKVFFVAKDGIYSTDGNFPISLTDDDLYPLFPHDGQPGASTNGIIAPDFTQSNFLRLAVGDSELRFDYKGLDGNFYTLVYDINTKAWFYDIYTRQVIFHYYEEGKFTHRWLQGTNIGKIFSNTEVADDGIGITIQFKTGCYDLGNYRQRKIYDEVITDFESSGSTVGITPLFNNYNLSGSQILTSSVARTEPPLVSDINSGEGTLARNIAVQIDWGPTGTIPRFYSWGYSCIPKVENTFRRFSDYSDLGYSGPKLIRGLRVRADTENVAKSLRIQYDGGQTGVDITVTNNGERWNSYNVETPFMAYLVRVAPQDADLWRDYDIEYIFDKYPDLDDIITSWTDGGYQGDKWLQGVVLRADTNNLNATVLVKSDDGTTIATLTCNHGVDQTKPYSWEPYITHEMRLVPQGNIRIIDVKWVFEPEPELTNFWKAQPTSFGLDGYLHIPDCLIPLRSTAEVTLTLNIDGVDYTYAIGSTGGNLRKIYIPLQAVKGKVWTLSLTPSSGTTGFRVYQKDIEFRVKEWGNGGDYRTIKPLGHPHALQGALI